MLPSRPAHVAQAALVALLAVGISGRGPAINRRADWTAHDLARLMAAVNFPPDSLVLGIEGETTALRYMQAAEGRGRAAVPQAADDPDHRRSLLAAAVRAGRPAFLTRELDGIATEYSFSSAGPLVRVWPRGAAQVPAPPTGGPVTLAGGSLLLEGYSASLAAVTHDPWLEVTLTWLPQQPLTQVVKVSLRPLDAAGAPLLWPDGSPAVEDRFPLRQAALSPDWPPGERIHDVHLVPIPPAARADLARVLVIVYDGESVAELGRVEIPAPSGAASP
jgi:hypothetical protein